MLRDAASTGVLDVADTDRSWSRDGDVFIPKEEISRRREFFQVASPFVLAFELAVLPRAF